MRQSDKEKRSVFLDWSRTFTKFSVIIIIFRYRLAPKHTFPVQFHDCYAVVRTLLATGDKYGIDTNRLVVAGDSAGGNLATGVALKLQDEGKQLAAQVRTPQYSSIEAVV